MPLLVLGVVRREHPPVTPAGQDEDDLGVRMVPSGPLAAAVLDIEDETQVDQQDAPQHLDLLIMLLRDGPVLPMSFGTVAPDDAAVREEVLDAAADDLTQRLDAVDGLVETRLDVSFDEATALRDLMQASPDIRGLAGEARWAGAGLDTRVRLGEEVSLQLTDWRRAQADVLLARLTGPVRTVTELSSSDPLEQRWAFLVAEDRLGELDEAVAGLRSSLGKQAAIEYVGPLPVYSFLEEAAPAKSAWGW